MKEINLNLGCWHRYIPGWVHIDLCDLPHIDHNSSIDDLSMFADDTVDLIYSSHSLEYFDQEQIPIVLGEWGRVLKKGGTLRIAVPDFEALIKLYANTGEIESILGPLYGRMKIETKNDEKMLYHKTAFTFDSLEKVLQANGFSDVRYYRWQDTIHKDFDDHSQAYYPHMDKDNGLLISLNIEATKHV